MTILILIIYVLGIYAAYFNVKNWSDIEDEKELSTLFLISLMSWLVFPIYGIVWLHNKFGEDTYGK